MLGFSSAEIDAIRRAQEDLMTETCVRRRIIYTKNSFGAPESSAEDVIELKCRTNTLRVRLGDVIFEGISAGDTIVAVTVPFGSDVRRGDIIEIGGRSMVVLGVSDVPTFYGPSALRCFCRDREIE